MVQAREIDGMLGTEYAWRLLVVRVFESLCVCDSECMLYVSVVVVVVEL